MEKGNRRFTDPLAFAQKEEKGKAGRPRVNKLSRATKSKISYKRRFVPKESKLHKGSDKYVFLFRYKTLVRFFADKYALTPNTIEFLTLCYSYDYFYLQEMIDLSWMSKTFANREWQTLRKQDYVQLYKTMYHRSGTGNLWRLSYKGNKLANRFYKMLLGEEELPSYVD